MASPVNLNLGATPTVVKASLGVLETLHLRNEHDAGLWIHCFDRVSADGIAVGTTPPAIRFFVPSGPNETDPPTTLVPMLRFRHGIVMAAVEEYSGGATGPSADALRGGAIVE